MRRIEIALSTLLISVGSLSSPGAQAATTQIYPSDPPSAAARVPSDAIRLAGSFQNSTAKLADKYLAGRSGGRYGIGGSESVIFKKKKKK